MRAVVFLDKDPWCDFCLLCLICQSVKDKAEILLQVEELLHIKEELSSQVSQRWLPVHDLFVFYALYYICNVLNQVTLLHGALEQERSKVKGLQTEQPKHPVRDEIKIPDLFI